MYSNLALSGGALRSISLLGAIKYLEEINILKEAGISVNNLI